MVIGAKQTETVLRQSDGWARQRKWVQSKMTNDPLRLAEGQSRRMRRWRDLYRWAARQLGEERMANEATRAMVIALVNAILASEDLVTNPQPDKPYATLHLAQTVASLVKRLGLHDAQPPGTSEPQRRGLLALMGEGSDG